MRMGLDLGICRFGLIGNKFRDRAQEAWLRENMGDKEIMGIIPYDEGIAQADLEGRPVLESLSPPVGEIFRSIEKKVQAFSPKAE